jgi:hypothetical protein
MKQYFKQKGTALIYVLAVVAAASVLFAGIIKFVVSHVKYDTTLEPDTQALHVAEAGIYFYRWYLAHNIEGKTASQIETFWNNNPLGVDDNGDGDCDDPDTADGDGDGTEAYVVDYKDEQNNVIGQYKICVTPPKLYSTVLYIESHGSAVSSGVTQDRIIRARLRRPSWSEFAILANNMIRLSEGTEVYGPMHVNGGFHFDGTAHNIVTSSVSSYYDSDGDVHGVRPGVWAAKKPSEPGKDTSDDKDDVGGHFLAGKQYPVVSQDFNSVTADFDEMRQAAKAITVHDEEDNKNVDLFYGRQGVGRFIEFGKPSADKMRITRVRNFDDTTYAITGLKKNDRDIFDMGDMPNDIVIYVRDNVWVAGTIPNDKHITIAAYDSNWQSPKIFLGEDDIFYEDYEHDTVLGLAAENDVAIIMDDGFKNAEEGDISASSGSDHETLHIDAVLLSQNGRVGWGYDRDIHNSSQRSEWTSKVKDTVELYGAIATKERMGFGYTNESGFKYRKLIFDNNLLYSPPPLFPTGKSYAIDQWDEIE